MDSIIQVIKLLTALVSLATAIVMAIPTVRGLDVRKNDEGRKRRKRR